MIITIDGPSGTGKSTVARRVAEKLGITFFDTGAMYRAVTWSLLDKGIDPKDPEALTDFLSKFSFEIRKQNKEKHYFVDDQDVTKEIRTQKITEAVSEISAIREVRELIWKQQRDYGEKENAVFEGRDMGSIVFPNADIKIFLDAEPKVRAQRRLKEMREKHPAEAKQFDQQAMEKDLARRDAYDSTRKLAPLICPKDAHRIDTSKLSIEQVVDRICALHRKKTKKLIPAYLHSKKMGLFYRFIICLAWMFFRLFYRHKVYGLEHYVKRAAIIAPNHTSYFDPPITAISWPAEVHFLAKKSLFEPPLFGFFIRVLNSHPVQGDAANVSVFKTILKLLEEGKQIILFPEGSRTQGELAEIKPGIGMLVMRSKSAIIPTYIHGAYEVWPADKKLFKLFGKTACVFGTPITWDSFAHLEKKEAQIEIAKELGNSIQALKAWYDSGAKGIPP